MMYSYAHSKRDMPTAAMIPTWALLDSCADRSVWPLPAAQNTWVYSSNTTNSTYFWSTQKMNFRDANTFCRARGAQLVAW